MYNLWSGIEFLIQYYDETEQNWIKLDDGNWFGYRKSVMSQLPSNIDPNHYSSPLVLRLIITKLSQPSNRLSMGPIVRGGIREVVGSGIVGGVVGAIVGLGIVGAIVGVIVGTIVGAIFFMDERNRSHNHWAEERRPLFNALHGMPERPFFNALYRIPERPSILAGKNYSPQFY